MGKATDLWDDSALINAFDQALSKYKMMHTSSADDDTTEREKSTNNNNDHSIKEIHENVELDDKRTSAVEATAEMSVPCSNNKAAHELSPIQESQPEQGTCFSELNSAVAAVTSTDDKMNSYEETEYAKLLSQYYEIEEKRQKVLQQLQQVTYWNYPSSTQYQTPEVHQGTNTSHLGLLSPCCMSLGQCCVCAMSSSNCSSFCPWDAYKSLPQTHQISAEEKQKGTEETSGVGEGQMSQTVDLETDLTVVTNAWYSAGFYTGRYLLEQSMKQRPH